MREIEDLKIIMEKFLPKTIVRFVNTSSKANAIYDIYIVKI